MVDSTARLANLQSGGLDLIERLLATDIKEVRGNSKLRLNAAIELGYQGLTINVANGEKAKNPLGADPRIRQALEASLDRAAITQVVFNGEFIPGNQWVSPEHPYYQKSLPVPGRDIAKAKALIKQAGVPTPIVVDFMVPNNPESRQVAEVMQAMAAEAGFDLKIRVTEFATSLKQAEAGEFQAYFLAWSGRPDPDGNIFSFATCKAPLNNGHYCDKDVDDALTEARSVSDTAKRKAAYEKAAKKFLAEGSVIYLYHRKILIAHTDKVEGYKQLPDGLVRLTGVKLK